MPHRGMIHVPSQKELVGVRFHLTTQNNVQFKSYESFFGIFHLMFLYQVAETLESET
jgi:hypothetical protein